ncbi:relaxase/mobilization nuclease domain protein [mine drainage metagenome]|uniref:Relaxase/mobilization nuclease domain protein n=1 Tax=mine drainage metagenome TaxID=410659 RepID=A0A1J5PTB9_9ZZZZ
MSTHPVISKITKGSSFAGALKYDREKAGAELLETNCAGQEWNTIAAEMETVAASNQRTTKPVFHVSLSLEEGQTLTLEQWQKAGAIYRKEMGFGDRQFVLTKHTDTKHSHVHMVINRIDTAGKGWSDSMERVRSAAACRQIERELGLKATLTQIPGRFEQVKKDLAEAIKEAQGKGLAGLEESLKERGYQVIENRSKTTGRLAGISIKSESDGKTWKASELQPGGLRSIEKQLSGQQQQARRPAASQAPAQSAAQKVTSGLIREITQTQRSKSHEQEHTL